MMPGKKHYFDYTADFLKCTWARICCMSELCNYYGICYNQDLMLHETPFQMLSNSRKLV